MAMPYDLSCLGRQSASGLVLVHERLSGNLFSSRCPRRALCDVCCVAVARAFFARCQDEPKDAVASSAALWNYRRYPLKGGAGDACYRVGACVSAPPPDV